MCCRRCLLVVHHVARWIVVQVCAAFSSLPADEYRVLAPLGRDTSWSMYEEEAVVKE